jgi:very-long-chain (3R)-3-hydroxyacyl-CoA dehydratase
MQVASRIFISIVCIENAKVYTNWSHAVVILSWGLADILRYAFYTFSLINVNGAPRFLRWLRYNVFLILYPSGAIGEMYLLYLTWKKWKSSSPLWNYGLITLMVIWLPCLIVMYRHMLLQRSRHTVKSKKAKATN